MALETYKIVNKSSPEFSHNLITLKDNSYNFRYKLIVELPRPRTTRYGKKSFSYEAAKLWNSLPNHERSLSTFEFVFLHGVSMKIVPVAHVDHRTPYCIHG